MLEILSPRGQSNWLERPRKLILGLVFVSACLSVALGLSSSLSLASSSSSTSSLSLNKQNPMPKKSIDGQQVKLKGIFQLPARIQVQTNKKLLQVNATRFFSLSFLFLRSREAR